MEEFLQISDQTVPYEDGAGAPPGEEDIFRLTKGVRCDCLSSGRLAYLWFPPPQEILEFSTSFRGVGVCRGWGGRPEG